MDGDENGESHLPGRTGAEPSSGGRLGNDFGGCRGGGGPPLLFALRLWTSVCFALYVAFWLQLDNAYWAGASAAIVCQPQLGASMRKAWFRMVGTIVGAVMIV